MILHRKLNPPGLPEGVVARARLDELLQQLLSEHEAVALFAAAGSGKTVQAQMFATRYGWPLAWLTLDRGDRSGSRLLVYLAESLSRISADLPDVVQRSLDAEFSLAEAAATLAESLDDASALVVLDDCEAIVGSEETAEVLETFLDYLPSRIRVLMLSREELDAPIGRMMLQGRVGRISDDDLALNMEEAKALVAVQGQYDRDLEPLMEATRGWIAAFAFDVRADLRTSTGPDVLASYLSREVLGRLPEEEQGFLLRTSLLRGVTPRTAVDLCGEHGHALWQSLVSRHLPATLTADRTLVYHPRFREFLVEQLLSRFSEEVSDLQRRHAQLLVDVEMAEEAVEVLLEIGDLDRAAEIAELALPRLFARADWRLLLRWIDSFGAERIAARPALQGALVRSLYGTRRVPEAQVAVRQLHQRGLLQEVVDADPGVVAYAGWALQWRPMEALALLGAYGGDFRADAVRYELKAVSGRDPVVPPGATEWQDMERIVSWGMLVQGRLDELERMLPDEEDWPPRGFYRTPHPLLGLVWRGDLGRARELFDEVPQAVRDGAHTDLWYFLESWLAWAEGDLETALDAAEAAVQHSRKTRFGWEPCFSVAVGYLLVSFGRTDDARSVLADAISQSAAAGMRAYVEWGQTFQGLAFLRSGMPDDAVRVLRQAVASMERANRRLLLPFAETYLSEAAHQIGDVREAQQAAGRALELAESMRAIFILQRALGDVPLVLQRQIDDRSPDSRWRRLMGLRTTTTGAAPCNPDAGAKTLVEVCTFGSQTDIRLNGEPCRVRRLKVLELAAYLALHPGGEDRQRLQERLFPDADQRRGGNYYRQVVHKLRQSTGISLRRDSTGLVTWPDDVLADATDLQFERLLKEASGLAGADRLTRLMAAIELAPGSYLHESDLDWVESRRFELEVMLEEARVEASQLCLDLGELELARDVAERTIDADPFQEAAYRVLMRVEAAIGPPGAVLTTYQRVCDALEELDLEPDASTRELLDELRNPVGGRS